MECVSEMSVLSISALSPKLKIARSSVVFMPAAIRTRRETELKSQNIIFRNQQYISRFQDYITNIHYRICENKMRTHHFKFLLSLSPPKLIIRILAKNFIRLVRFTVSSEIHQMTRSAVYVSFIDFTVQKHLRLQSLNYLLKTKKCKIVV